MRPLPLLLRGVPIPIVILVARFVHRSGSFVPIKKGFT